MRKILLLLIAVIMLNNFLCAEFDINGEIKFSEMWYIFHPHWQLASDNFHLLDIYGINESEDETTKLKVRFQIRMKDNDLTNKIMCYEIIPWEVWVQFRDLFIDNLKLKIGKQYFEWGTADGIHPSSVLTPDDYSNPLSIGEKIPIIAFNVNYFYKSIKLYLIWIPQFIPAKMPEEFPLMSKSGFTMQEVSVVGFNSISNKPDIDYKGNGKAIKLKFSLLNVDFSTGYFEGYDYLPQVRSVVYSLSGTNQFKVTTEMFYPYMKVYTFDWTTSVQGIGFWGEIGIYKYDEIKTEIISPTGTDYIKIISKKPYANYITGIDYNFESGFYLNLQYSYGLPFVRGKDYLEDYIILSLKDTFFDEYVEIESRNILGFNRKYNFKENYEIMLNQSISILPLDDLKLTFALNEIDTKGEKMLLKEWKEYDSLSIEIKYSF